MGALSLFLACFPFASSLHLFACRTYIYNKAIGHLPLHMQICHAIGVTRARDIALVHVSLNLIIDG